MYPFYCRLFAVGRSSSTSEIIQELDTRRFLRTIFVTQETYGLQLFRKKSLRGVLCFCDVGKRENLPVFLFHEAKKTCRRKIVSSAVNRKFSPFRVFQCCNNVSVGILSIFLFICRWSACFHGVSDKSYVRVEMKVCRHVCL